MGPLSLDHVALWVAGRERIVAAAEAKLGLRVIERTDRFTLLGDDPRRGKLTLFDGGTEGAREQGALARIGLRVASLDGRPAAIELGEGIDVALVERPEGPDLDLDHVALVSSDPAAAATGWERLGFLRVSESRVSVGGAHVDLLSGEPGKPDRPLLNHIGVLVESVEEQRAAVEELGVEIDELVDAPNTVALFVWGPDRVRLEYIEHKPSFALA